MKQPQWEIVLDLDDVVADFAGTLCRDCGPPHSVEDWPPGVWALEAVFKRKGVMDGLTKEWWASLPPTAEYPALRELLALFFERDLVVVATSATRSPDAAWGKTVWCNAYLPEVSRVHICLSSGASKADLAAPYRILVDDAPHNCKAFEEAGGKAFLWPTRHNRRYVYAHAAVPLLEAELRAWGALA